MILPVVQFPDALLKTPARDLQADDPALKSLLANMKETLYHHPRCVGLAAPQLGAPVRLIVVDASRIDKPGSRHGYLALLNPKIIRQEGGTLLREGCLSVPDYTGNVLRATAVVVRGIEPDGAERDITAEGFEAVVFQHEVDHLNGKLFLDRVGSLETDVFRRKKYY